MMHDVNRSGIYVRLLLILVGLMLCNHCTGAQSKRTTDLWSVLKGYSLSSVAWSPNGDRIAFVVASYKDGGETGLLRASIWTWSLPKPGQTEQIRRLAVLSRKQGIPAALFWLDAGRIGWAASQYSRLRNPYTFMQMGLHNSRPESLVVGSFEGIQTLPEGFSEDRPGAPDDVCYDRDCRTLLFSGGLIPRGVYVRMLPLSTGKVRNLSVPLPKGFGDGDYVYDVTLYGSVRGPNKPVLYLAAGVQGHGYESRSGYYVWRSDSYSLRQDKVLASMQHGILRHPRLSPDGKTLAWLRWLEGVTAEEIVLSDLRSGTQRVLVKAQADDLLVPAMGCPFSWSPDGKKIAYADGSRIKILEVNSVRR